MRLISGNDPLDMPRSGCRRFQGKHTSVRGCVMRIAVTGAAGRLGEQVVQILAATGDHQVIAVSRRSVARTAPGPGLTSAIADYADPAALRAALRGVDTLVFVS